MRSLTSLLIDLCLVLVATVVAVVIRDNFEIVPERLVALIPYLVITLSVAGLILFTTGINRSLWRFTSMRDYLRIVAAMFLRPEPTHFTTTGPAPNAIARLIHPAPVVIAVPYMLDEFELLFLHPLVVRIQSF